MKVVVDRFEGDYAVVLFEEGKISVNVPRCVLPEHTEEGNWLKVCFKPAGAETERRRKNIEGLFDRMKDGS